MPDLNETNKEIIVISKNESFLAKSLVAKMEADGVNAVLSRGEVTDIGSHRESTVLFVLFMGEDEEDQTEMLVYLKDLVNDMDKKVILIGEQEQRDIVSKILTEDHIHEWFKRPLVMDDLIKCIRKYIEDNTGEKRKKTVLIVDDDITYMRTVYEWLKDVYHVGMATNGVQAISYLTRNKADLVLLDYEMPIANGPQVLAMLKNDSETGQIPVMFLTGHGDRESVLSVVGLSPVDYLLKTIDKDGLRKKLSDFFARK